MLDRLLLPALTLFPLLPAAAGAGEEETRRAVEALTRAFNDGAVREFHDLCTEEFQKELSRARLERILRQQRAHYGKLTDGLKDGQEEGPWLVFRPRCEKRPVLVKVGVTEDGRVAGLLFVSGLFADLPAAPIALDEVQRRLGEAVEQALRYDRLPSVSLALVKDDQVVWARAFGHLNKGKAVPADEQTVYVTGSILKVVVATALVQLADEGKLDLDAPVNGYLKGFQVPNPFEEEAPLTARHLLSHRGGLPNWGMTEPLWRRRLPTPVEELLRQHAKVEKKPGEEGRYTNLGYTLNAYLLGQVTGKPFESELRRRLFEPLEMTRTAFTPTPEMTENLALPYQSSPDRRSVVPCARVRFDTYPAGDAYSTPGDMARFLIPHLNGGKYRGRQLLSAGSVAEMARVQFAEKDDAEFGLGWVVATVRGRRVLTHSGAVPGFASCMTIDPAKRVGAVVFANRFDVVAARLGLEDDPLPDLCGLALELLDRLGPGQAAGGGD